MDTRPIRFVHRGRIVSVEGAAPTRSVLEWLREDARCTGTKEGCAEGDCGACTVIVAELAEPGAASGAPAARATVVGGLSLRPVNACIRFLPTLDGKALLSVEDLAAIGGDELHPVQQAMVECHGSQCGFCTPGFVMTLAATYEHHHEAGTVAHAPATGRRAVGQPVPLHRLPADPRCRAAHVRAAGAPAGHRADRRDAAAAARRCAAALRGAEPRRGAATASRAQDHFFAPRTLDQLATLARRAAAGAAAGRLHRHRPVGQQDVPRPGRHRLRRRGRRAEAHHRGRRRIAHRRRRDAGRRLVGPGRALARGQRSLAALCRPAGAPRRHDGRQRRQRLADRRQRTGADRAGREHPAAPWRGHARDAARGLLPRLHEEPAGAAASSSPASACRCPRRRSSCAPTRSASATTATSRRCLPAWRSSSTATWCSSARFAFGGMAAIVKRARGAEAAVHRPALDRGHRRGRDAGARQRLHAAVRPARQRRLPAPGGTRLAEAAVAGNADAGTAGAGQRVGAGRTATA